MLLLTEADVRQVLTMDMALEAVEAAFRALASGDASNIPRARVQTGQAMLHTMSAAFGYIGYKAYVTSRSGATFHVALYDGQTGALLSLMQADYLGQVRTGAASGVATQYMARPDAAEVGLFGSGKQARTQLIAVCQVRKIRRVQVYSRDEEHRRRFAEEMTNLCQVEIEPVPRPELAAQDKDIVITATTSREPVLYGKWLADGTHLNVVGSNFLNKAEVDATTIRMCDVIVVDSKEQALLEAGDFVQPLEDGVIDRAGIHELADVIAGRVTGRATSEDTTMFKSVGIAVEDVAVAARVYARAVESGLGKQIDW